MADGLTNPVFSLPGLSVRDPAAIWHEGVCYLYYTRHAGDWEAGASWDVGMVATRDFGVFSEERVITPKGYASPGNVVRSGGEWIMPLQSYPWPSEVALLRSRDLVNWSEPDHIVPADTGLGWDDNRLLGFKPTVGFRINPRFTIAASYGIFSAKSADDALSFIEDIPGEDLIFAVEMTGSTEFQQKNLQLLTQFYPAAGKGLFLVGGLEFVSFDIEYSQAFEIIATDNLGSSETISDSQTDRESKNATGLLIGAGFDISLGSGNAAFTGAATYSFSKYEGQFRLEDFECNVGGPAFEAGIKVFFPST